MKARAVLPNGAVTVCWSVSRLAVAFLVPLVVSCGVSDRGAEPEARKDVRQIASKPVERAKESAPPPRCKIFTEAPEIGKPDPAVEALVRAEIDKLKSPDCQKRDCDSDVQNKILAMGKPVLPVIVAHLDDPCFCVRFQDREMGHLNRVEFAIERRFRRSCRRLMASVLVRFGADAAAAIPRIESSTLLEGDYPKLPLLLGMGPAAFPTLHDHNGYDYTSMWNILEKEPLAERRGADVVALSPGERSARLAVDEWLDFYTVYLVHVMKTNRDREARRQAFGLLSLIDPLCPEARDVVFEQLDAGGNENAIRACRHLGPFASPAVPKLMALIENGRYVVESIRALEEIGPSAETAVPLLVRIAREHAKDGPNPPDVLYASVSALGSIGGSAAASELLALSSDAVSGKEYSSGSQLMEQLGRTGISAGPELMVLARDALADEYLCHPTVRLLGATGRSNSEAHALVFGQLRSNNPQCRQAAVEALGLMGDTAAVIEQTESKDRACREAAVRTLGKMRVTSAIPMIEKMRRRESSRDLRETTGWVLAELKQAAVPLPGNKAHGSRTWSLRQALMSRDEATREKAEAELEDHLRGFSPCDFLESWNTRETRYDFSDYASFGSGVAREYVPSLEWGYALKCGSPP